MIMESLKELNISRRFNVYGEPTEESVREVSG
jgi:hypothetical protein